MATSGRAAMGHLRRRDTVRIRRRRVEASAAGVADRYTGLCTRRRAPMKILHVIPGLTHEQGGTAAVAQALARCQAAAGHEVTLLTTDSGVRRGEHPLELPRTVRRFAGCVRGPDRV